ncbi:hypothetical protein [Streptomyces sp. NPDC006552]|uniref:hypothetical protein n=1 Tax=Streptomyces sp. NPDC006552 TaxID=3157179 RepID=UPI00339EC7E4
MIRAGRRGFVQNSADLAAAMGFSSVKAFRNRKPHEAPGFPAPISAPEGKGKLWDAEQTAAYINGDPVPALPARDDDEDLLERTEAAAYLNVTPKTWDSYKRDPRLAPHLVVVGGVEHCPRHALRAYRESGAAAAGQGPVHRPRGSGDMVPRDQLPGRVGELLDADPALTLARLTEELGIANSTATRILPRLRGERIAALCAAEEGLSLEEAAQRLNYPAAVRRSALTYAATALRALRLRPYVQEVIDALISARLADPQQAELVPVAENVLAAAVPLAFDAPVPALAWDERWGWRTAVSRRHPLGRESGWPPQGDGIRYIAGTRPAPREVVAALYDGRTGSGRPSGR